MGVTKPYKFIGCGAMDVTKPYKCIRFGAMDVTKPYTFIWFGAMAVTKLYKFTGFGALALSRERARACDDPSGHWSIFALRRSLRPTRQEQHAGNGCRQTL